MGSLAIGERRDVVAQAVDEAAEFLHPMDIAYSREQVLIVAFDAATKVLELSKVTLESHEKISPAAVIELYLQSVDEVPDPRLSSPSDTAWGLVTYLQEFGYLPKQLDYPGISPQEELQSHFRGNTVEGEQ
jgi:hypothetical protein